MARASRWLCLLGLAVAAGGCGEGEGETGQAPGELAGDAALPSDQGPEAAPADAAPPVTDAGCACPGRQTCTEAGCAEPETCEGPEDCAGDRACEDGVCVAPCGGDPDCPMGQVCEAGSGRCVDDTRCAIDADCAGGICVDGACRARCGDDQQCPGRQVCDASGRCVEPPEGCGTDEDCLNGRRCLEGACVSVCAEDADCAGAQRCVEGGCAEPAACTTDLDCLADRVCQGGQCGDPCARAGCPGGLVCDEDVGRCREELPCRLDDGCFAPRRCVEGACAEPCGEDADCPAAQRCVEGRCGEPEVCNADADCVMGRVCQDAACRDRCEVAGCPGDTRCDAETGRCTEPEGGCRADADCLGGRICAGAACVDPCRDGADCDGAQRCEGGRCLEPDFCNGDLDCLGERRCVDNQCVEVCGPQDRCPGRLVCAGAVCVEGPGCDGDRDCLAGRRCHPQAGVCVDACPNGLCPAGQVCTDGLCGEPAGCLDDSQCIAPRVCRLGACRAVGCEASGDCPGVCLDFACAAAAPGACACPEGWLCDSGACEQPGPCDALTCPLQWHCGADGLCARCALDEHCPAGVCRGGRCDNPAACAQDRECLPGYACSAGQCAPRPGACTDDALAGHHAPELALALPAMALSGLTACEGRPDWFRIALDGGARVVVRWADPAALPLRVALYDAGDPFAPMEVAASQPGEAQVAAGPGEYYVEVSAPPGASGDYEIEVVALAGCVPDAYERPWRNDDRARARPVGAGRYRGTLCGGDEDWFHFQDARRVRVEVEGAIADVDGQAAPVEVQGPARVRVTGAAGATYTLTLEVPAQPAASCARAAPLGPDQPADATVEAGADDFAPACRPGSGPDRVFRISVAEAGVLAARLDAADPRAALLLYRDCAGEPVACSAAAGEVEAPVEPGDYFLVVDGPYAGDVRYTLRGASPACAGAAPLPAGVPTLIDPGVGPPGIGGACTHPELGAAVRAFDVPERSTVRLRVEGGDAESLVSLRASCDDDGTLRACEIGADAAIGTVLPAGRYHAIIQAPGPVTATLTLEAAEEAGGFGDACDGDAPLVAPGTELALAGDLGDAADHVALDACAGLPGAPDAIARFRLAAPATVFAYVDEGAFSAQLALLDGQCGGAPVCGSAMTGDVFAELPAGTHALAVESQFGGGGPFRVVLQVE